MSTTKRKISDDVSSRDEINDGTIEEMKDLKENNLQLIQLMKDDTRIGWPDSIPAIEPKKHGWFRQGNLEVLQYLLQKDFKIIVELGSWLGSSTKFILTECPDAVVFAVDIWSNEHFLSDSHYDKTNPIFTAIINGPPIYDQFLRNTWDYRYRLKDNSYSGLIPMKMDSVEALRILKKLEILPDLIYIDASHHFDFVVKDILACLEMFPGAMIVGDDWDNLDVRRAALHVAKLKGLSIFSHKETCWTYEKEKMNEMVAAINRNLEEEEQRRKKLKIMQQGSFADLLNTYKSAKKR